MAESFTHTTFLSPFTWRYGSEAMRTLWSEHHKRLTWRRLWVALAEAQSLVGLTTVEQVADLQKHLHEVDIEAAHRIEAQIQHDLMAEVRVYADQCPVGGGIIHLGATSMDIEDNADALRLKQALALLKQSLQTLLTHLADQIEKWGERPCMAYTHLQPAEPTTIGYRLALYGQDLLADYAELDRLAGMIRGKGFKGAVGSAASYTQLLAGRGMTAAELDRHIMESMGLQAFTVTGQTYPRKQDWWVMNGLAGVAMSLYKFAFDLRLLQSPPLGEWAEPFGKHQVGSSAMPFKRNPIHSEKLDSLGRLVASLTQVGWDNAAHSLLERTLDDSANRREVFPVAFLAVDEMIMVATRLVKGLRIDEHAVARNLTRYGTFAATERLLMEAVKSGADRQVLHEVLREASLAAWTAVGLGAENPLIDTLCQSPEITRWIPAIRVRELMNAADYVGDTPVRALQIATSIREMVNPA
jgi:adenylosuccinate lyase